MAPEVTELRMNRFALLNTDWMESAKDEFPEDEDND
jgi:hypothetical protein